MDVHVLTSSTKSHSQPFFCLGISYKIIVIYILIHSLALALYFSSDKLPRSINMQEQSITYYDSLGGAGVAYFDIMQYDV